ncbi:Ku protein [Streptomyces sp. NBC_01476]|uniref:non-homologous end joining protein Ku n=1 Tax=Streptomyces sp. NBC_01476 TaxID=2903881 RepID=UPI002E331CE4|nr:Ku protein [Streptomyces sp. NBC_01476]
MRSVWSGNLAFGLVSIPVKLGAAVSSHKISFRQIHLADQGRVRYQKTCELDEEVLSASDIGRAYETPDQLVEITDADLKALPLPTAKTIEINGFLDRAAVDSLQLDTPYFLAPATPAADKPYVLMREALARSGKAAVGKFAMRNSEHLALVQARDDVLVLQTLRWPDELNSPAEAAPRSNVKITDNELRLADTLIEALGEADLGQYHDEYAQAVEALVSAKLEGVQPPTAGEEGGGGKVVDLMAALQASVDQARGGDNAQEATVHQLKPTGRKKAPAKKAATKKTTGTRDDTGSAGSGSAGSGTGSSKGSSTGSSGSSGSSTGSKKSAGKKAAAKKAPAKSATSAKKTASRRRTG